VSWPGPLAAGKWGGGGGGAHRPTPPAPGSLLKYCCRPALPRTSTVTLCSVDGEALAVKAYAKARLRPRHRLNLRRELTILTHLRQAG
jgi:hypothetical protein